MPPDHSIMVDVDNLEASLLLGQHLGKLLFPNAVIALIGPLGAGKTHFVRAIAEGLEVPDSRIVNSPTFVLIQEYPARLPIYHFDAYRLRSAHEFAELGVHEYFEGDGVCLIEWADRVESALPAERLWVTIEITGATSRRYRVEWKGERYRELAERWFSVTRSA